jgi:hypothetical protein
MDSNSDMGILSIWSRKTTKHRVEPQSRFPASAHPVSAYSASTFGPGEDRKQAVKIQTDLLRIALRDITALCGIPSAWLEIRPLVFKAGPRNAFHIRVALKHWNPLVLRHAPALERLFLLRVNALDPGAKDWIESVSWQLALPPGAKCEDELPEASAWTAATAREAPKAIEQPSVDPGASIIQGPVRIVRNGGAREALDELIASHMPESWNDFESAPTEAAPLRGIGERNDSRI